MCLGQNGICINKARSIDKVSSLILMLFNGICITALAARIFFAIAKR